MGCMETLLEEMPLEAWLNSPSTLVCQWRRHNYQAPNGLSCAEMLTPVDQSLDTLTDLKPDEMYVLLLLNLANIHQNLLLATTWKVRHLWFSTCSTQEYSLSQVGSSISLTNTSSVASLWITTQSRPFVICTLCKFKPSIVVLHFSHIIPLTSTTP